MKILLVMDPGILVPPKGYGGHERLVAIFAKEYRKQGHEVHLLATGGSEIEGCIIHGYGREGFPPRKLDAARAIPYAGYFLWKHRNDFDLVHNFGRLAYLLPILNHPVKKIMTYGREISIKNIDRITRMRNKNIVFTGCSTDLITRNALPGRWETVYNAIEFDKYKLNDQVPEDAPFIFLSRIERIKGCHTAIEMAKATGNDLIIAGNVSPLPEEKAYFEQEIKPRIDGRQIRYVGQVNDEQKNLYLGQSKALLSPIEWNEPFGMVMVEAMACGTPVIGMGKGSVPEVIEENITGVIVNDKKEFPDAMSEITRINRNDCRRRAQERFDVGVIARHYLSLVS